MGSRSSLLVLSLIALVLAVALSIGGRVPSGTANARVLPGFDPGSEHRLVWRRAGAGDVAVEGRDGEWRLVVPVAAPAVSAVVEDALGTLELLAPRQRGAAAELGEVAFELQVDSVTLRFGHVRAGVDRAWVVASNRPQTAFAVDGFAVRALDRTVEQLRSRVVFDLPAEQITGVELHAGDRGLLLSGVPLAVHVDGVPGTVRAAPKHVAHIVESLASLRAVRFVDGEPPDDEPSFVARVIGGPPDLEVRVYGRCDGALTLWLAATPVGLACLPDGRLTDLRAYVGTDVIDRRLIAGDRPERVRVGEVELRRHGAVWRFADGAEADARAVEAWLAEVRALAAVAVEPRPAADVDARVDVGDEAVLVDTRARRAWREGEGVALVLPTVAPLLVDLAGFRSREIFSLEPLAMRWARRGDDRIERGETHDDWGAGVDVDAVRAFRAAFARLRADRFEARGPGAGALRLEVAFDPPPGGDQPVVHVLEIDGQCRARADGGAAFAIEARTCAALRRAWR